MRKIVVLILVAILPALLTGCVTYKHVAPPQVIEYEELLPFNINGRASIQYEGGGEYVRFAWQADKNGQSIQFYSPIGTPLAYLNVNPLQATFQQGKTTHTAEDAEVLMQSLIKWHLPIKSLRYWILGLADVKTSAQWRQDRNGWYLNQSGWQIYFTDYVYLEQHGKKIYRPKRINLKNSELSIKMVVSDWKM